MKRSESFNHFREISATCNYDMQRHMCLSRDIAVFSYKPGVSLMLGVVIVKTTKGISDTKWHF